MHGSAPAAEVVPSTPARAAARGPRTRALRRQVLRRRATSASRFRGVTYGTFRVARRRAAVPASRRIAADLDGDRRRRLHRRTHLHAAAATTCCEAARARGLRVMAGVFFPDWRYSLGAVARRAARRSPARPATRSAPRARELADDPVIAAVCVGNEIPADVVRWVGAEKVAAAARRARRRSSTRPTPTSSSPTRTTRRPSTCRCRTSTSSPSTSSSSASADFRAYLTRLHHLAGDRPLVLGEIGLDAGGRARSARPRCSTGSSRPRSSAASPGPACSRGPTSGRSPTSPSRAGTSASPTSDRAPAPRARRRPPLERARPAGPAARVAVDQRRDLRAQRRGDARRVPRAHLRARLPGPRGRRRRRRLDGRDRRDRAPPPARAPDLDRARRALRRAQRRLPGGERRPHRLPRLRRVPDRPSGRTCSRSAFDGRTSAAPAARTCPPLDDAVRRPGRGPRARRAGARPDRRRPRRARPRLQHGVLEDGPRRGRRLRPRSTARPATTSTCAGRCSTAAGRSASTRRPRVWHHRRPGVRTYARQQRGYGRAEALVQARHPDRFTPAGHRALARQHLRLVRPDGSRASASTAALYGAAAYQSVYRGGGHTLDIAAPGRRPARRRAAGRRAARAARLAGAGAAGAGRPAVHRRARRHRRGARRAAAAAARGARALPRARRAAAPRPAARAPVGPRARRPATRCATCRRATPLPGPVQRQPGGVLLLPLDRARADLVPLVARLAAPPRAARRRADRLGGPRRRRGRLARSSRASSCRRRSPRAPCSCACAGRCAAAGSRVAVALAAATAARHRPAGRARLAAGRRGRRARPAGACGPARPPRSRRRRHDAATRSSSAPAASSARTCPRGLLERGWDVTGVRARPRGRRTSQQRLGDVARRAPPGRRRRRATRRCSRRLVPGADAIFPFAGHERRGAQPGPRPRGRPRRERRPPSWRCSRRCARRSRPARRRLPGLAPAVRARARGCRSPRSTRCDPTQPVRAEQARSPSATTASTTSVHGVADVRPAHLATRTARTRTGPTARSASSGRSSPPRRAARTLPLYGGGGQLRDYVYVDDLVELLVLAATHPDAVGGVFNAGGPRGVIAARDGRDGRARPSGAAAWSTSRGRRAPPRVETGDYVMCRARVRQRARLGAASSTWRRGSRAPGSALRRCRGRLACSLAVPEDRRRAVRARAGHRPAQGDRRHGPTILRDPSIERRGAPRAGRRVPQRRAPAVRPAAPVPAAGRPAAWRSRSSMTLVGLAQPWPMKILVDDVFGPHELFGLSHDAALAVSVGADDAAVPASRRARPAPDAAC